MPTTISPGAYFLYVSFYDQASSEPWVSIQDNDLRLIFSRTELATVVVPWQGEIDQAQLIGANFDDQIELAAFAVSGMDHEIAAQTAVTSGTVLNVALYWQAKKVPADDYTVFVHLLDANGQLVASHDSQPMAGAFAYGIMDAGLRSRFR